MAFLKVSLKYELIEDVAEGIYSENFVGAAFTPFGFFSNTM